MGDIDSSSRIERAPGDFGRFRTFLGRASQCVGLLLIVGLLLMTGCATAQKRKALVEALHPYDIQPSIVAKMEKGKALTVDEIIALSRAEVPAGDVIDYLKLIRPVYHLSLAEVDRLREAEVDDSIIEFLLRTPELYDYDRGRRYDPWFDHYPRYYHYPFIIHHHHHHPDRR